MSLRRPVALVLAAAVALAAAVVLIVHQRGIVRHPVGAVVESGGPAFDPIRSDEIESVLPPDAIPALVKPAYLSVAQASDINDQEQVIGVVVNGDARAYPLSTLSVHEIVDDEIGGKSIAVTW